jgi:methyl-accepting chemotaxis protein
MMESLNLASIATLIGAFSALIGAVGGYMASVAQNRIRKKEVYLGGWEQMSRVLLQALQEREQTLSMLADRVEELSRTIFELTAKVREINEVTKNALNGQGKV